MYGVGCHRVRGARNKHLNERERKWYRGPCRGTRRVVRAVIARDVSLSCRRRRRATS